MTYFYMTHEKTEVRGEGTYAMSQLVQRHLLGGI